MIVEVEGRYRAFVWERKSKWRWARKAVKVEIAACQSGVRVEKLDLEPDFMPNPWELQWWELYCDEDIDLVAFSDNCKMTSGDQTNKAH
jgi:hypothetical protein